MVRDDLAVRWIITIQCHNQNARNSIIAAGNNAVVYLMNKYGGGYKGGSPAVNKDECLITVNNKSDRDLEIYAIYFRVDQNIQCGTLAYEGTLKKGDSWKPGPLKKGESVWAKFKTQSSGSCQTTDVKFEINGLEILPLKKFMT